MGYLERNQRLLAEVQAGVPLKRGKCLTQGYESTRFTALGAYHSAETGGVVYLGLKEYEKPDVNRELIARRAVGELLVMQVILEGLPHLLPELPHLYGLIVGQNAEPVGIITEDFSQGGSLWVYSETKDYRDLEALLEKGAERFNIATDHMAFSVGGKRRLGDFWMAVPRTDTHWERWYQIEQEISKYTVKIDYPL